MAIEKKEDQLIVKIERFSEPPSYESQGPLINNYELYKDKECKIWRGDAETPENLIFGFDKEDIESIEEEQHTGETRVTFKNGDFMEFGATVDRIKTWLGWEDE
ncbi:hypothetical protein PPK15_gp84 [Bacillus phage 000TH010]|uniref:Uncharacterized protein n=1 Tax=Bacillus phage 000TH010 TaxID=2601652 RepID=A0A5P8PHU6_9CAUD|nr:hypothetical protein PPK15_gp84 [Bacillus phage 000TH010]QFR56297.1 hypothetical protein 000TH010_84 [Bacillus phage 000TH010]